MGRYFPRHSSRTPFNVPLSAGFLRKRQPWKGYIPTILSFRRSVAAVCEAGILRSFLLLSLFFGGAPPLQCSTTARAVGPILRLVPGTTGNLITNLTNRTSVDISREIEAVYEEAIRFRMNRAVQHVVEGWNRCVCRAFA